MVNMAVNLLSAQAVSVELGEFRSPGKYEYEASIAS